MNSKSNLLLILLLTTIIGIVSWFAYQQIQQQSQQIKLSQMNSSEQALVLMQNNINDYVNSYSDNLLQLINQQQDELLREIDDNPSIHRLMIFDLNEQLQFSNEPSLEAQKQGLKWLQSIPPPAENQKIKNNINGWFTWYDGQREKYIFWGQNSTNILLVELNNSMFKADLIYWLSYQPDITQQLASVNKLSRVQKLEQCCFLKLTDNINRVFYQWGDSEIEELSDINIQRDLSNPLSGWSLKYYARLKTITPLSKILFQSFIVGLIGLLILITFQVIKIRNKEQKEAMQKLSFINQVSHELKTPLTNIRLHGDLLEMSIEKSANNSSSLQSLAIIQQESQRLTRLINNVLNFNSVEKQSLKLKYSTVDFAELLQQAILPFQPSFESLNIQIEIKNKLQNSLKIDADVFKQIIANLLSNVEKYANQSEKVRIDVDFDASSHLLTVLFKDQGDGISDKEVENIFKPFYRIDNSLKAAAGSGLGLALARDLARLHGGDLELLSTNTGACFKLTLKVEDA